MKGKNRFYYFFHLEGKKWSSETIPIKNISGMYIFRPFLIRQRAKNKRFVSPGGILHTVCTLVRVEQEVNYLFDGIRELGRVGRREHHRPGLLHPQLQRCLRPDGRVGTQQVLLFSYTHTHTPKIKRR